jgi:hypothetical protein
VAVIALLIALGSIPNVAPLTSPAPYVAAALACLCAWLLSRELRRDVLQLSVFWVFFGVVGAMGALLLFFNHRILGAAAATFFVSTWLACLVILARSVFVKDSRPHELIKRFGERHLFEHAGVQLAVELADSNAMSRGVFEVQVFLQNCWDKERSATLGLYPRCGFFGLPGGAVVAEPKKPIVLRGAEVGVLAIPVRLTTTDRVSLQVTLNTSGLGGKRIWRRPAQTIPMSISPSMTVVLACATFGTFWAWGGGLFIRVPAGPRLHRESTLRERRWRSVLCD